MKINFYSLITHSRIINKNFKDINHAYTIIVDEFYKHTLDLKQNFK
jgi:hypothetical protein